MPATAENSEASGREIFSSSAFARTASARGCSLFFSIAAAIFSSSLLSVFTPWISVTAGFPWVMVPVLSRTTL